MTFFATRTPAAFAFPTSTDEFAFRYYDASRKVLGKTMAEQLRFAMCWWHTTCWPGGDPFGGAVVNARLKEPGIAIGYSTTGGTSGPSAGEIADAVRTMLLANPALIADPVWAKALP